MEYSKDIELYTKRAKKDYSGPVDQGSLFQKIDFLRKRQLLGIRIVIRKNYDIAIIHNYML